MNMWADTLPNNSFTSCKLLIDVQEHRYHPYRFRSTNRIQQTVSYTVSKAHSEKSICSPEVFVEQQKFSLEARNRPSRPGTGKAFRPPGNGLRPAGRHNKQKMGVSGALRPAGTPTRIKKGPSGNPPRDSTRRSDVECGGVLLSHTLSSAVPSPRPGLSFRVRKGTGRLTWAMTTAKPIQRPTHQGIGRQNRNHATIPIVAVREPDNGREQNASPVSSS